MVERCPFCVGVPFVSLQINTHYLVVGMSTISNWLRYWNFFKLSFQYRRDIMIKKTARLLKNNKPSILSWLLKCLNCVPFRFQDSRCNFILLYLLDYLQRYCRIESTQIKKIEVNSRFNSLCNTTKRIRQKCKIVSKAVSVELWSARLAWKISLLRIEWR